VKKFAVFDIDGTLFRWQLYYEAVLELRQRDFFDEKTSHALDTAYHSWQSRRSAFGEFEKIAIAALDQNQPRLSIAEFKAVSRHIMSESSHKVYSFTRQLAHDLKKDGYYLLAISGSHQELAEPFSKIYGFDDCLGWLYGRTATHYTSEVVRNSVSNKKALLKEYAALHNLTYHGSVAVGDSKGDIGLLESVERPIAFNPSQELLDAAMAHSWEVVIERKNIAYHLRKDAHGSVVLAKTDVY